MKNRMFYLKKQKFISLCYIDLSGNYCYYIIYSFKSCNFYLKYFRVLFKIKKIKVNKVYGILYIFLFFFHVHEYC